VLIASLVLLSLAAPDVQPKIVVPKVTVYGVQAQTADVVTELLLEALLNRHGVRALGPSDMKDMLDAEQQKMMLGCDQESCMAELAGAMGAERLIAGSVGMLGAMHVVTLKLIDTKSAQVTSRASRRFNKIEEVPEAIGPLVDDLLKASPNVRAQALAALDTEKKEKPAAMSVRDFCRRSKAYDAQLEAGPYDPRAYKERHALLEDLLYTPFLKEFDQKLLCVREHDGRTSAILWRAMQCSSDRDKAVDLRRRRAEWGELVRQVELLEEAYKTGFEKEKSGAGARPSKLPFPVSEKPLDEPENTAETRRYLDELIGASKALTVAVNAAKAKDAAAFSAAWSGKGAKDQLERLDNAAKNGYAIDVCPVFVLSIRDIEQNAEEFAKSGVLTACVRRVKDGYAYLDDVEMKLGKNGYQIETW
jgi:hypothetical protein